MVSIMVGNWYMSHVSILATGTFFYTTGSGVGVVLLVCVVIKIYDVFCLFLSFDFDPWDKYSINLMRFD